jgi:hypothetical protein
MSVDLGVLASITAAVSALGDEILKDAASDTREKVAWTRIKKLLGWTSDPAPAEISQKAASALTEAPDFIG